MSIYGRRALSTQMNRKMFCNLHDFVAINFNLEREDKYTTDTVHRDAHYKIVQLSFKVYSQCYLWFYTMNVTTKNVEFIHQKYFV